MVMSCFLMGLVVCDGFGLVCNVMIMPASDDDGVADDGVDDDIAC